MVMSRPRGNPNWKPGVSGFPAGRPRTGTSLTSMIRSKVPLDEIVYLWQAMAWGEPVVRDAEYMRRLCEARAAGEPDPPRPAAAEVVYPTIDQQQSAMKFLAEWGYQRPAERLEIAPAPEADLSALTDEELEVYERLLAKASGAALPPSAPPALPGRVIDAIGVEVAAALPPGR